MCVIFAMGDMEIQLTAEETAEALKRDDGIGLLVNRAFSFEIPPFTASFALYGNVSTMPAGRYA